MALFKNVASQKIAVYAHDTSADAPKTGDAANITAQISKDFGAAAATNDINPTELDATDHPGVYVFDLTQAETNAEHVLVSAVSSTSDISIEPVQAYTRPPNFSALAIDASGNLTGSVGSLGTQAKLDVNAEVDTALSDYDAPTNAEMEARTILAASYATATNLATVDTVVDGIKAVTDLLPDSGALSSLATQLSIDTMSENVDTLISRLTALRAGYLDNLNAGGVVANAAAVAVIDAIVDAILVDTGTTIPAQITGLNNLSQADVRTAVGLATANLDTQLAALPTAAEIRTEIDSNSTQLAAIVADTNELQADWANGGRLDLILDARASQASVDGLNDLSTADVDARLAAYDAPTKAEMDAAFAEIKGATWLSSTDTLEQIRDNLAGGGVDLSPVTDVTDRLADMLENSSGTATGWRFTEDALANAPTSAAATVDLTPVTDVTDRLAGMIESASGTGTEYRFTEDALLNTPPATVETTIDLTGQSLSIDQFSANALNQLSQRDVQVVSPVVGNNNITIVEGDSYRSFEGRQLVFSAPFAKYGNLNGYTGTLYISKDGTSYQFAGTVVNAKTASQAVHVELMQDETAIQVGAWNYSLVLTRDSSDVSGSSDDEDSRITHSIGTMTVKDRAGI